MKKSLVLMAMAGVALASCVNDVADVAQNQEQKKVKIAFDSPMTMMNAESRANYYGEIGDIQYVQGGSTYTYPRAEDFRIFAIEHVEPYAGNWINNTTQKAFDFNDEAISFDTELDGWAPLKKNVAEADKYYYWPSDTYLSFAAVSPADMEQADDFNCSYGDTGLTLENFVVPLASVTVTETGEGENKKEVVTNNYHQFDLLFSKRALNCTSDDMVQAAGKYSGIPIHFQHALSSIRFSLDKENVEQSVYLKEIRLYGVKSKGKFEEGITEDGSDLTKYDRSETGGNVVPVWTPGGDLLDEDDSYCAFYGRVEFKSTPQYVKDLIQEENQKIKEEAEENGTTPQLNNSVCNQLLLMPQVLEKYESGKEQDAEGNVIPAQEGAVLYVRYEIGGEDRERWVALKGKQGNEDDTTGPVKIVNNWEVGVRYTYRLVISAGTIENDKIYFAPQTDAWKDVTAIIVNL